jgi:hypothetical protein
MNFDPDGFVLANRPAGSIVSWAPGRFADRPNYKTKSRRAAKWQTRILAPPGTPDGHGRDGGTWRCVHLPHLISTPKCRRSSVASRVLPCLSVVPIAAQCQPAPRSERSVPFLAGLRRTSRKRRMSEFQLFSE